MKKQFDIDNFLMKYPFTKECIEDEEISYKNLKEIYEDYMECISSYENQANFIANILRSNENVHSVKSRLKNPDRLIEKVIRKTRDRREKYGNNFNFEVSNYKKEVTDLIGIRVLHIFKDQWRDIHEFITNTWKVIEITANVRAGDNTEAFHDLNIEVKERVSGYRSVHYLVELNFTHNESTIAEIQVRTIFEEGYGEIDHRLRYSHQEIPDILKSNLMLFNRLVGSADEMASLINNLSKEWTMKEEAYKDTIKAQQLEIELLKKSLELHNIK